MPASLDDTKPFRSEVSAKWIPALALFMTDHNPVDEYSGDSTIGLHIAPHPDGGVTLMSTNGRIMLVVRDQKGVSRYRLHVTLPPHVIDACRQPKMPDLYSAGETIDHDSLAPLPSWMAPGMLGLSHAGAYVWPQDKEAPGALAHAFADDSKVHRIGQEYRVVSFNPIDYRHGVEKPLADLGNSMLINTNYMGRVCEAAEILGMRAIRISRCGDGHFIEFADASVEKTMAISSSLLMPPLRKRWVRLSRC